MRLGAVWTLAAPVLLALTACEPTDLYLASRTVIGVNAVVNPEQTSGTLLVGYDRAFATVIPRSVNTMANDGSSTNDAMSALVCSRLAVSGVTIQNYTESIATGPAAKQFAGKLTATSGEKEATAAAVKDFFDCFKNKTNAVPAAAGDQP